MTLLLVNNQTISWLDSDDLHTNNAYILCVYFYGRVSFHTGFGVAVSFLASDVPARCKHNVLA